MSKRVNQSSASNRSIDSNRSVVQADGLGCPRCNGPVNFITPYYGKDEYDIEKDLVGARTWWAFVPFVALFSALRAIIGNTPGAVKELYHCDQCNLDLSYKEAAASRTRSHTR